MAADKLQRAIDELAVLNDELLDARRRLNTHGVQAEPMIFREISMILRDIGRNTAKIQACAKKLREGSGGKWPEAAGSSTGSGKSPDTRFATQKAEADNMQEA